MHKNLIAAAFSALLAAWSSFALAGASGNPSPYENACDRIAHENARDSKKLHDLLAVSWKYQMTESPEDATYNGFPGVNDRWTDDSLEALSRRKRDATAPLRAIRGIHRQNLSREDKLNYDLFRRNTEENIEGWRYPGEYLAVNQLTGPQQWVPQVLSAMPHEKLSDFKDILARLEKAPALVEQTIMLLQEGVKHGVTSPKITMRDVPDQFKALLENDPDKNSLLVTLREFPASIPAQEARRIQERAKTVLKEKLIPAYRKLRDYLVDSYIPACRESVSWAALPDGKAWYEFRARQSTTTRLTPAEIHRIGVSEVKRIRAEMDQVIASTGFKGSFEDFKEFLRTDSRFFYDKPEELLSGYRDIAKRIDPELIRLFGKLPRLPYGVKPVPSYAEKSQTTAYYEPGSPEAGRGGYFFANTYDLKTRPKWEMEALTCHEAVPGHHLQISLAEELPNVPEFRRFGGYTAFVEGWGLYSESLCSQIGMYQDPYSKFGQLTYEMWRAIRLVVDTGIHSMGWTRDQAIDYFKQYTSKTDHDITVEVDRYIVWAGQALAYKIGELKFKELREQARKALGDRFDIRAFHDTVLSQGALPLDNLQALVDGWLKTKTKR